MVRMRFRKGLECGMNGPDLDEVWPDLVPMWFG